MTGQIRLVLAIHNHQPVGNFDGVFEDAYRDSYAPFLEVLTDYPDLPISLHTSGSLLEWLVDAHPDYIDRVRELTERGQVEVLGGPFYEPILSCIPRRDRIGQIASFSRYLERLFGTQVRGMWVPERVWEQGFAADIANAGIEYTVLDDFHFRGAGLRDEQLHGYFLTEDEGRLFKIFPGSERLRYTIPFAEPHETIDYLRGVAERTPNAVITFGDDGEKFGTWPGTNDHVYKHGWLRRFFDTLMENRDWLRVVTLAEAVDHHSPTGRCYLPDASYREMTEWALPAKLQTDYKHLVERNEANPDWNELKQFMRGGFWRNFRVKYVESNEMYARQLEISNKLDELSQGDVPDMRPDLAEQARIELYRAQCNCAYWHGAFGGLYLPHLRNAIYKHLIAADSLLETARGRSGQWVQIDVDDYDLDARMEIRIAGDRLVGYLAPSRGGHLYEFDVRGAKLNLLATLNRREEPYHDTVREVGEHQHEQDGGDVASIHDMVSFKQPDLHKKLVYDRWPRKSLVDHFLQPGLSLEDFQRGDGCVSDFAHGVYQSVLRKSDDRVEARMSREGQVGPYSVQVVKTVSLDVRHGGTLEVDYDIENLPAGMPFHFAIEFNFAGMAAGASDRYFYNADGQQLGQLESVLDLQPTERIGLIDEWLGLDASVEVSKPANIWAFPIQTVSQSEGGFELVHQSSAVVPHWEFTVPEDGRWQVHLRLSVDTSAAQARELREAAVSEPLSPR